MSILDDIVAAARKRVERDKRAGLPEAVHYERIPFSFEQALGQPGISFICEVKKASPSKGVIAGEFPYLDIARDYQAAGAAAVSVLTEPDFFLGSDRYLAEIRQAVAIPLLRKDFVVDPFQIEQAARLGADAVLLICAVLDSRQLKEYIHLTDSLGLSCLVEAHDESELRAALAAGARVVGVNNRDLRTFTVDLLNSCRLRKLAPREILFVAESGIRTAADVEILRRHGVDAVLVGETLMRAADRRAALAELRGGAL